MLSSDHESSAQILPAGDHRRIAREMNLLRFDPDAPGQALWLPDGWFAFRALENLIRGRVERDGYEEVNSPQMMSQALWERSGHWEKYAENMIMASHDESRSGADYALKPMSCPGHIKAFSSEVRSWRDLPVRYAEFGRCVRYEPSGALQGLMRLRAFTQDDGHVFCAEAQVQDEAAKFIRFVMKLYADLGFADVEVFFSDRPKKRIGSDAQWDAAEAALRGAAAAAGVPLSENPGEGAFYGPKLEFSLRDAKGRVWQCGTLQADFMMSDRFGISYVDSNNAKVRPVILHRAALGSLERFIGILLENAGGRLPAWMMRNQAVILPVSERHVDYAHSVEGRLLSEGVRVKVDARDDALPKKIRDARLARVPAVLVVGDEEQAAGSVAVKLGKADQKLMSVSVARRILQDFCQSP